MKLVTFMTQEKGPTVGVLTEGGLYDLSVISHAQGKPLPSDMLALLNLGESGLAIAGEVVEFATAQGWPSVPMSETTLLAPIPRPPKVLCAGANFQDPAAKVKADKTTRLPIVFLKPSSSVIGPNQPIILPRVSEEVAWELEMVAVLGRGGRMIPADKAEEYIIGYTIFNDVSCRSLTLASRRKEPDDWAPFWDWMNGKWPDTFAPLGPYIVTKDEIPDPYNLHMQLRVNGEVKQDANTKDVVFTFGDLIEFASEFVTIEAGTVVASGTPHGVGESEAGYLRPGDIMEGEITGLGTLVNPVRSAV